MLKTQALLFCDPLIVLNNYSGTDIVKLFGDDLELCVFWRTAFGSYVFFVRRCIVTQIFFNNGRKTIRNKGV